MLVNQLVRSISRISFLVFVFGGKTINKKSENGVEVRAMVG